MKFDVRDRQLQIAINVVWRRLPASAIAFFEGIDLEVCEVAEMKTAGDAGVSDIRVRSGLPAHIQVAVISHELGHVAGLHVWRVARGELTAAEAEAEADKYARSWGFGAEIAAAQRWRDGRPQRPIYGPGVLYSRIYG